MQHALQAADMAHVIQLSVAPVFLLSGIGALLSVLTTRVGRIVDRARQVENKHPNNPPPQAEAELDMLSRRARMANWAISLCTTCALLICALIVMLFVGAFLGLDMSTVIALLFMGAMAVLILGLLCFLREIHLAIASLRIRRRKRGTETGG